jgi:hypothetical protein
MTKKDAYFLNIMLGEHERTHERAFCEHWRETANITEIHGKH